MRIGFGFDCHPLREERKLILGGVEVPYSKGLYGHSDADCLVHAICDALLGSIGAGDIGRHFPDDDPSYKGINSLILLFRVKGVLDEHKAVILNIDSTIICEAPKLSPYIDGMIRNIAETLGISENRINIKATRGEGLGFIGRGEGISAYAVVSVEIEE